MPLTEQTPLITTVHVVPREPRYRHSTLRRFCTIALSTTLIVVVILFLIPINWLPHNNWDDGWDHGTPRPRTSSTRYPYKAWPDSQGLSYNDLQEILLSTPDEAKVREWSRYYTSGPHLAGKNLTQALWTRERWQEFGVSDSNIVAYDVYINYHVDHRLALLESVNVTKDDRPFAAHYDIKYECMMREDVLDEDPTTGLDSSTPTYHGYSASGDVIAEYVYVNFGTYWDFEDLVKANVSLEGKIAISKYGRGFRGLKVKRAQELGMVGIVLYTDPQEDGEITEENGYKTYPDGPARNPSSVQRGSVQYISVAPGDPTTIGYPSKPGVPRQGLSDKIPSIPSVPISYQDALPILQSLNGHGPSASEFNEYWQGGGLAYRNVSYNIGPSPSSLKLHLVNEQEYTITRLWDVIGIINGTQADEVVILGNHRDAWIAGGAGDPNSGSAAMNELIRSFGLALKKGWKPRRTIVFASWDGEEYGLIGSTEWVEEYLPWLSKAAVAYLNVDVGTRGPQFTTAASPLLNELIRKVTGLVRSPNQTIADETVRDTWDGHIRTIGSGSDFTSFQDFAGIPSVDIGFARGHDSPVYHYHSSYDSFHWMDTFGDKKWQYHTTITKVLALLALNLIESPIIPFNATGYAEGLASYIAAVKAKANNSVEHQIPFRDLELAAGRMYNASISFDHRATVLQQRIEHENIPWWKWWQKVKLFHDIRAVNDGYKYLDRHFLHEDGLDGRSWFKHVVYAPGIWTGYAGSTLPGLIEAVDAGNEEGIEVSQRRLSSLS
ncbi:MAG: hypothetical protein Q9222_006592 [Ikaeria aurantiellina]